MPRGAVLDSDLRFDFDRKGKAVFLKFRKRVERFGCELVKVWGETWFTSRSELAKEAGATPPHSSRIVWLTLYACPHTAFL